MTLTATDLDGQLERLETLLAEAGEEAMLLSELDGYLCAVLVTADDIPLDEWWPTWLETASPELVRLVELRYAAIEQELGAGSYAPLYDVDEQSGAIAWQVWLAGFEQGMQLRFDLWDGLLRHPFQDVVGEAMGRLALALLFAQPGYGPDDTATEKDWADYDEALAKVPEHLAVAAMLLYQANLRRPRD